MLICVMTYASRMGKPGGTGQYFEHVHRMKRWISFPSFSASRSLLLSSDNYLSAVGGARAIKKGKAIDLDDIKFHQRVRLARFENDRTIAFIRPDGSFDLMTYRLSTQVKPLIWVEAQVERHSRSRIEISVKARSQFKERSTATNVEIELPVTSDATNPNVRTSMDSASYAPENDALVWKIKSFPGGKEYMFRAEFTLPSITAEEAAPERKAPIRVKFEIPYFTISGIQDDAILLFCSSGC
ncbi:clathrin adaptor complexes medium subunit family protein [Actinidia rufa]|uniref:Clathrin adaptor complexes medium subunit family protein n=1 Tax=Actinidia rufa TaxID=165716 RepID=A0A7J0EYB5_9ERIC|nr:clathrin adaptor complexes medium subunit family protein [Actinidia rufa]